MTLTIPMPLDLSILLFGSVSNRRLSVRANLVVPDIGDRESGFGTIYDVCSFPLNSSPNIANQNMNRVNLILVKTETPINFEYFGNMIGFYSSKNYNNNDDSSADDYEIIFQGGIRGMGTIDTEDDELQSSTFPTDVITTKNTGYLNILTTGFIHFINRTPPTD